VVRHANAKRVGVRVDAADEQVTLEVADDGDGFDTAAARSGFGLTGMSERVALVGGSLNIVSDASGTILRAQLPIHYSDESGHPG